MKEKTNEMTLLLAANTAHGIVMMSDGLSRRLSRAGLGTELATDLQKMFPVKQRPIAIAHHGQNQLAGRPVSEIIADHQETWDGLGSVQGIAQSLHQSLDEAVRDTLRRLRAEGINDGCGFWIGGYGVGDEQPSLCEVFWAPGGDAIEFKPISVLAEGGEGKRFAQAARRDHPSFNFTEDNGNTWSLLKWSDYIERLYKAAARLPGAKEVFGGKVRKLCIEKTGHRWMMK